MLSLRQIDSMQEMHRMHGSLVLLGRVSEEGMEAAQAKVQGQEGSAEDRTWRARDHEGRTRQTYQDNKRVVRRHFESHRTCRSCKISKT